MHMNVATVQLRTEQNFVLCTVAATHSTATDSYSRYSYASEQNRTARYSYAQHSIMNSTVQLRGRTEQNSTCTATHRTEQNFAQNSTAYSYLREHRNSDSTATATHMLQKSELFLRKYTLRKRKLCLVLNS